MKFLLIACFVALAAADVSHIVQGEAGAEIVEQNVDVNPDGSFKWSYKTGNGIQAEAQGQPQGNGDEGAVNVQGSASWSSPEGENVQFQYIADENGYQPQGSHIPTPHPIPDYIQRSLEYNAAHPQQEEQN